MAAAQIPKLTNNIYLYKRHKEIINLLSRPINIQRLPIIGESKIFKGSAERYGHVIIKLSLETDEETKRTVRDYYSYEWLPETTELDKSNVIIPLERSFEKDILNELKVFTTLLELLNENTANLRFSVVGGSYRITERPYFGPATVEALIQIFNKLA